MLPWPTMPEIDDRLMTEPPRPCFFIAAIACFMPRKTPVLLMPISRCQAAVGCDSLVDRRLPSRFVGDVEMEIGGRAARLLDVGCDGFALLVEDVRHHHGLGAFAAKHSGGGSAHPAGSAGDQGDFVLHP